MSGTGGEIVIAAYRPKAGKADTLLQIVRGHVAALREVGLVTSRPSTLMRAADGTLVEVFEWNAGAAEAAHDHPLVQAIWGAMEAVCDFVPLSSLTEVQRPFPHFTPV